MKINMKCVQGHALVALCLRHYMHLVIILRSCAIHAWFEGSGPSSPHFVLDCFVAKFWWSHY